MTNRPPVRVGQRRSDVREAANRDLAARARQRADRADLGSLDRAACLVAAVALGESRTVAGARKVLAGWDGAPTEVREAAIATLDALASSTP